MIFVNFKTYLSGTGENAVRLAETCQRVGKQKGVKIFPLVQAADVLRLSSRLLTVWAQHADPIKPGAHTGQTLLEALAWAGADGVMLNHSENKQSPEAVGEIIKRSREHDSRTINSLEFMVCAEAIEEGKNLAKLRPDWLVYEPPELIGSREASVATAKQDIIKKFVGLAGEIPVLVGAGVQDRRDVEISLEQGAAGILVSSAVMKAEEPERILGELAGGFAHSTAKS